MTDHGTDSCYAAGCRRQECRAAHAAAERGRRRRRELGLSDPRDKTYIPSAIFCAECQLEVEACDGRFGEWMHTATRCEIGEDGHVALPETVAQIAARGVVSRSERRRRALRAS